MECNGSLIVKHFVTPSPNGANEFDSSYPIVGDEDLLNDPLASIATNKLPRCRHLDERESEGGRWEGDRHIIRKYPPVRRCSWENERPQSAAIRLHREDTICTP